MVAACPAAPWQALCTAMLPTLRRYAVTAFRRLRGDNFDDAVQEALANACVALANLARRGELQRAFPTILAQFAIRQVRAGRRVGNTGRRRDVLSPIRGAQARPNCSRDADWLEAVLEDPYTPVFEQVCFRLDFPAWLDRLPALPRRVAETLALGHSTSEVAAACGVTPARTSQLRRELHSSWQAFGGELAGAA